MMATGVPTKLCNQLFFFFSPHFVFQPLRSFIKKLLVWFEILQISLMLWQFGCQ